jgi:methyl-accepting chemotaxis protein
MLNNMKLTTKVIASMAVTIVGMLVISVSTYIGLSTIGSELEEIAEYQVPINKVIVELEKDILKEEILTFELFIEGKDPKSDKFAKTIKKIKVMEEKTIKLIKKSGKAY